MTTLKPDPLIDVLAFWWQAGPARWFDSDAAFDATIRERFLALHERTAAGALDSATATPHGALAVIILLDQFPRNMFRSTARAFATDAKALAIAEASVGAGLDAAYPVPARMFFYMPFMHAEDLDAQDRCVGLFSAAGDEGGLKYAVGHRDTIRRFGRFPHRNTALGRISTPDEAAYSRKGSCRRPTPRRPPPPHRADAAGRAARR
jgi:uncharacterized protein (DUF924 family)